MRVERPALLPQLDFTDCCRVKNTGLQGAKGLSGVPAGQLPRGPVLPGPGRTPKPGDPSGYADRAAGGPARVGTTHRFRPRVWRSAGRKPSQVRTFQESRDPHFEEKLQDGVGRELNPPENAAVFRLEEKSSI